MGARGWGRNGDEAFTGAELQFRKMEMCWRRMVVMAARGECS